MKAALAQYIDDYCKKNKISKERLANHADIARSTLYDILNNETMPTLLNITKLAMAMQVHPQYLIKLEWNRYRLQGCRTKPLMPLQEPELQYYKKSDSCNFISETVADGSIVCTNERFFKTWRLQNTGEEVWEGRRLQCQNSNDDIYKNSCLPQVAKERSLCITPVEDCIDIPTTAVGELVDLTVELIAPSVPCHALSYWKIIDKDGEYCFPESIGVYAKIQVVSAGSACI